MGVKREVDLCAAPGSWSQVVLSRKLYFPTKLAPDADRENDLPIIVAIDLQPVALIEGVNFVYFLFQFSFHCASSLCQVIRHFDGCKADLVVCDGAPDDIYGNECVTGLHDMDEFVQSQLIIALKLFYPIVTFVKPKSTRNSSIEAFAVSENNSLPEGFNPKDLYRLLEKVGSLSGVDNLVNLGDLEFDAVVDGGFPVQFNTFAVSLNYKFFIFRPIITEIPRRNLQELLDPVQPLMTPPYKRALELKKASCHCVQDLVKLSLDSS
ncbi:hypothetical protein SAY87_023890 [Trapa incisa]|uniref:Ribosomal RNA methyltransferase FtsJ domain-containing protein n=1 Tax=Trapa incisa TaxID=236973 RepID=A0AAN7L1D9_9MYRT|nr:hypothetical protein SAY87_023890 [Trapa incisa]